MTDRAQDSIIGEQHHDHIWLTVYGEGWAIRAIDRGLPGQLIFHLWRGYSPDLEFLSIVVTDPNWTAYCERAVEMLGAYQ